MTTPSSGPDSAAVARAHILFESTFSTAPTVAAAAPGRVNLIGEHTDYNDGFVFPLALEKNTYIVGGPSPDDKCHLVAEKFPDEIAVITPGNTPAEEDTPGWAKYIKGMTALYERNNHKVTPFRAAIVSDVPLGSGLSSSAALEMATGVFLEELNGLNVDPSDRAKMGQKCEHDFAGVPCGIMDQLISSRGEANSILLIDCRSLEATPVKLSDPDVVIFVTNSRVKHDLGESPYKERRDQCESAAKAIAAKFPEKNVKALRDATLDMLDAVLGVIDETTARRAKHAISEDVRTLETKQCLEKGDLERVGQLMYESHKSLRDKFEVSIPEIDGLVEIARGVHGVYGSRITGGGFGGCTVTLLKKDAVPDLERAITEQYPAISGGTEAEFFSTNAGMGARPVTDLLGV